MAHRVCRSLDIPANLNLEELIVQHSSQKINDIKKDKLAFICNTIYYLMNEQSKELTKQVGFVRVQSKYLKRFIPDYHFYMKCLLNNGILESCPSYRTHHYSKGYKFSEKYLQGSKKHAISSQKFSTHIDKILRKLECTQRRRLKKATHLQSWLNDNLKIDKKAAKLWIRDSYNKHIHAIEDAWLNNEEYYESIKRVDIKHQDFSKRLNSFKIDKYSVDRAGYRFHNALTLMKSELRNFIEYNGEKLAGFDNKTSQPYFTLLLFQPEFYYTRASKEAITLKKLYPELYECLKYSGGLRELQKIAKLAKSSNASVSDIIVYKEDIIEKDFYQVIANFIPGFQSREIGKSKIFPLLFENWEKVNYGTPYTKAFKENYPTVYEIFSIFKRRKHNDFAKLLQRIESSAMYGITEAFNRLYPDTPIFPIHDNFITTEAFKWRLNDLIITELTKYVGQRPNLSETAWKSENAKIQIEI